MKQFVRQNEVAASPGSLASSGMESQVGRSALLSSAATFSRYHWIMLRNFHAATVARLGEEALPALDRGYRQYGRYRGQSIRDSAASAAQGRGASSLVRNWDGCDFILPDATDGLHIEVNALGVRVEFPRVPGSEYFVERSSGEALEFYWRNVLAGIADGYGEGVEITSSQIEVDPTLPWAITFSDGRTTEEPRLPRNIFDHPERAIMAIRRTAGLLAAFQMSLSAELISAFDATGEEIVRQASYGFGAERGSAIREQHIAEGRPLNLESFLGGLQERDPAAAIFVFRDEGYLSPGVWQADCTYCPLAEIWAEKGAEGLRLGYLFDAPNHRGLFESYHPGTVVRWRTVKSRGDAVCRFRFSIPQLMTAQDPGPDEEAPPESHKPFLHLAPRDD